MEFTLTVRCRNKKELQEVAALLSREDVRGGAKDLATDAGTSEEGYSPSCERTRLGLDALNKCQRVQLSRPSILESWAQAFPHVDLAAEIAKAEAWAQSKDVKRSPKGWAKALNSWLGKAQDKAKGAVFVETRTGPVRIAPLPVDPAVDEWAKEARE